MVCALLILPVCGFPPDGEACCAFSRMRASLHPLDSSCWQAKATSGWPTEASGTLHGSLLRTARSCGMRCLRHQ